MLILQRNQHLSENELTAFCGFTPKWACKAQGRTLAIGGGVVSEVTID
jgi:hypothetical protein